MEKPELIREAQTGRVLHDIATLSSWLGFGITLVGLITRSNVGVFLGVCLVLSLIFSMSAGFILTNTLKRVIDGSPDAGMTSPTRLTEQSLEHAAISWERVQRPDERIDGVAFYTATGGVASAICSVKSMISVTGSVSRDDQGGA